MRREATSLVFDRPRLLTGHLTEPRMLFAEQQRHVDPKTGLSLYGPYRLEDQAEPSPTEIKVGIVSPSKLQPDVRVWIRRCQQQVRNDGSEPLLYPHFPGMNRDSTIGCALVTSATWEESLPDKELVLAMGKIDFYERVAAVATLYRQGVENINSISPKPDVVVCVIPQEVLDVCTLEESKGERFRRKFTKSEREARVIRDAGQMSFFPANFGDEDWEVPGHRNLRRAIKAETMSLGLPTQLLQESTLKEERKLQDVATRAWNFSVGLYYKAGGLPWRVADLPSDTCYIGVAFYRERLQVNPLVRGSLAQIFSRRTDGLVLRGSPFDWDDPRSSPHLSREGALELIRQALDLYMRQAGGSPPRRVVVHKSSVYWDEELQGFHEGLSEINTVDLLTVSETGTQLMRLGNYPPIRGTWLRVTDEEALLYTGGYVPYLQSYPGMRAPRPLGIRDHHGPTAIDKLLKEVLILTKMNWNTADFACSHPMTIAFARRVGEILGELPEGTEPNPEYRFYM